MYIQKDSIQSKHGKPCIITLNGSIIIEPKIPVDTLYNLSYGYCQVEKDGKFGYIDRSGELIIPFQYQKAFPFSENGLAFVQQEDGLGGYINKDNEFVIPAIYETGSIFRYDFAAVSRNGEYEYINSQGLKSINATFTYASGFSDYGLAKVIRKDGAHSLMDSVSREVLLMKAGNKIADLQEGTRVTKFTSSDGRDALINAAGEIVTRFYEAIIIYPHSHLHPFRLKGLWGYLNDRGEEVIPNIYSSVSAFSEEKIAFVKTFHPLAENNVLELYINPQDDIVDARQVEGKRRRLQKKFSQINQPKRALALATKRM